MKQQDPRKQPVSLEDLMRIKRAERPAPEFWSEWQKSMRARTRSAALEHRPWWRDALPRTWISIARWQTPIGAAALGALVYVAVHEYRPALAEAPVLAPSSIPERTEAVAALVQPKTAVLSELRDAPLVRTEDRIDPMTQPGGISNAVAMISLSERDRSPAARRIAANFATARAMDSQFLANLPGNRELMPVMSAEDIPAAAKPSRRENLLGIAYLPTASYDASSLRGGERVLSRLNEEQVYENTVRRLGAKKWSVAR
jgi:hypothetical protein